MDKILAPAEVVFNALKNPRRKKKICIDDQISGIQLTYADADCETALVAGLLKGFYINPGDTVSTMLENGPRFLLVWLGAVRVGAVAYPINCFSKSDQIIHKLHFSKAKLLILQERYAWDESSSQPSALLQKIRAEFPGLKIIIAPNPFNFELGNEASKSLVKEKGAGYCGAMSWKTLMQFIQPYDHVAYSNPLALWVNAEAMFFLSHIFRGKKLTIDFEPDRYSFRWKRVLRTGCYMLEFAQSKKEVR